MNSKPIIIAIVGDSGSGKTTLSYYLRQQVGIPFIVSYTTRPMRDGEIDGVDHHFTYPEHVPDEPEMFAYTKFADYEYWTTLDQFTGQKICSYVIDEKGLIELLLKWKDRFRVVTVYVKRPNNPTEQKRKNRDKDRVAIPEEEYNVILENDGTLNEFFRQAIFKIGEYIAQTWK